MDSHDVIIAATQINNHDGVGILLQRLFPRSACSHHFNLNFLPAFWVRSTQERRTNTCAASMRQQCQLKLALGAPYPCSGR